MENTTAARPCQAGRLSCASIKKRRSKADFAQAIAKTKPEPSAAGPAWGGGARERADGVFLCASIKKRRSKADFAQAIAKTKPEPSKAGPGWRGGARERADGVFLCASIKMRRSKADFAPTWRRWRDSNSRRAFDPYTISNRARSTNYATSPRAARTDTIQLTPTYNKRNFQ